MSFKISKTFQGERTSGPHSLSVGGLRDCELHNGHLVLEGLKFSRVLKDFKLLKG